MRRVLEETLSRQPNAVWLRIMLADLLLLIVHDENAAEAELRKIVAEAPNELQCRLKLAHLQAKRGE